MENNIGAVKQILKGILLTITFCLVGILLFSVFVGIFCLPTNVIKIVNTILKIVFVFLGCFFTVKEKGILLGAITGGLSLLITYFLLCFIGNVGVNISALLELILGIVVGAISGIITVNIKNKNR